MASVALCKGVLATALLTLATAPVVAEPYYASRAGGWFWYQDPPPPLAEEDDEHLAEQEPPEPQTLAASPEAPDYKRQLQGFQQELEQSLARAIVSPEPEHLRHYMSLNAKSLALAGRFADSWQLVLQRQPELDYRLHYPTDDQAVQGFNYHRAVSSDASLKKLAGSHGLLFMFRGDCPVCHRFAPVLRRFAQSHGFTVLAVSLDGGKLEEFPQARMDNGIAARLDVELVPALFLVAPRQGSYRAVGYGYMSGETLRRQLLLASEAPPLPGGDG